MPQKKRSSFFFGTNFGGVFNDSSLLYAQSKASVIAITVKDAIEQERFSGLHARTQCVQRELSRTQSGFHLYCYVAACSA